MKKYIFVVLFNVFSVFGFEAAPELLFCSLAPGTTPDSSYIDYRIDTRDTLLPFHKVSMVAIGYPSDSLSVGNVYFYMDNMPVYNPPANRLFLGILFLPVLQKKILCWVYVSLCK